MSPNAGIWKHLFFCERLLLIIGSRVFGSKDALKDAVVSSKQARADDAQMIDQLSER